MKLGPLDTLVERLFPFPSLRKKAEPRGNREFFATTIPHEKGFVEKMLGQYSALNSVLKDRLGCVIPSHDPYGLLAYVDSNGFLSSGMRWKGAATVGAGFDCHDELRPHLEQANERESFQDILDQFALDVDIYGNGYIEVVRTGTTANFYNVPALKTRVMPKLEGTREIHKFARFEYDLTGQVSVVEFDELRPGNQSGVVHFKLPSRRGSRYYGDAAYLSAARSLSLNIDVLTLAEKFFQNGFLGDLSFTLKGAELTKPEKEGLRTYLQSVKGLDHAHKILFFEVGPQEEVVIDKLNTEFKEDEMGKHRDRNREEIISANDVPPRLVGVLSAGQLGGTGEVEGQLRIFKLGFADARQVKYETFIRRTLKLAGLPHANTFTLKSLDVTAGSTDMQTLDLGIRSGVLSVDEAREEWNLEKATELKQLQLLAKIDALNKVL